MGVFGAAAAGSIPESVSSPPAEIRELPATTTPADLTNSEQPDNAWTPLANENDPPGDAEHAPDEPADANDATASSTPPASDQPPADRSSEPVTDVSTASPVNDNDPVLQSANDNPPPFDETGTE